MGDVIFWILILFFIGLAVMLIYEKSPLWKFCGWVIGVFVGIILISGVISIVDSVINKSKDEREQAAKAELQRQEQQAQDELVAQEKKEAEQRKLRIEDMLRSFTLKEAPKLWNAYQNLQAEIANQNSKIEELRKALKEFDQDPDTDADFKRVCSMRDDMVGSLKTMRTKIEDAYLAACKYEATPGQREYDELRRKLLEDGTQEAEAAVQKYNDMKEMK